MSTVVAPRRSRQIPAGWVEYPCSQCQAVIVVLEHAAYAPICRQCRRGEAEREATKLTSAVNDLINGTGEFNILTQSERQERLQILGIDAPAKVSADDAPVYEYAPDAATRDEIEDLCCQMDASAAQDASERPDPYEQW